MSVSVRSQVDLMKRRVHREERNYPRAELIFAFGERNVDFQFYETLKQGMSLEMCILLCSEKYGFLLDRFILTTL